MQSAQKLLRDKKLLPDNWVLTTVKQLRQVELCLYDKGIRTLIGPLHGGRLSQDAIYFEEIEKGVKF